MILKIRVELLPETNDLDDKQMVTRQIIGIPQNLCDELFDDFVGLLDKGLSLATTKQK